MWLVVDGPVGAAVAVAGAIICGALVTAGAIACGAGWSACSCGCGWWWDGCGCDGGTCPMGSSGIPACRGPEAGVGVVGAIGSSAIFIIWAGATV